MTNPESSLRQALVRHRAGDFAAAIALYEAVLAAAPGRADVRHWLALALTGAGRHRDACRLLESLLAQDPDHAEYRHDLAAAFWAAGDPGAAERMFRSLLARAPDMVKGHLNLGALLAEQWRYDEALACLTEADRLRPGDLKIGYRLGRVLNALGRLDQAIALYRALLKTAPDDPELHYDLAMALLRAGRLPEGFAAFEWRFKRPHGLGVARLKPPHPRWQGETLAGRGILIWREQGLGDELYFAGLYPEIVARAARTVIDCDPRLAGLFARSFPGAEIAPRGETPDPRLIDTSLDYHSPAGSLARWLRPTPAAFPASNRFLRADTGQVRSWRRRLARHGPGPWIGISWRSGLVTGNRSQHYSSLDQWGPIFALPGAGFVNLQYDRCGPELDAAEARHGIDIVRFDDLDLRDDLDTVAALTTALDAVVAPPNAVAAMAGALGVPVWMMTVPDIIPDNWAYLGTDHLPWLPAVRVMRQRRHGEWAPAIEATARALARHLEGSASG